METEVVDKLDEAWRSRGIKNRMEFFRGALSCYLKHLGAEEAAALFACTAATGVLERVQKVDRRRWQGEIGACHHEASTPRI
jgi:metal-responsive CopG/Arc/MetJ family transcriptional regulator